MSFHDVKLGKKAAVFDSRVPMLAAYRVPGGLPSAPPTVDWSRKVTSWGMMLNDELGDCTCAGLGHAIQDWTLNASGKMITLPDDVILSVYEAVGGYVPGNEGTDNGAVMLDVCKYWAANPIGGHALGGFASLSPTDVNTVKEGIWLYGGIYVGVLLPVTAQSQSVWMRVPGPLTGDAAPGSWGGHAIYIIGYDEHYLTCISWGQLIRMTWEWFTAYCDEAYVLLSKDWISNNAKQQAPSGYDYATLLADQHEFAASALYGHVNSDQKVDKTEDKRVEWCAPSGTGVLAADIDKVFLSDAESVKPAAEEDLGNGDTGTSPEAPGFNANGD